MSYSLSDKKDELDKNKSICNRKYTRKVYSNEEIREILKDYIEVEKSKFSTLKAGQTRVCYIRADDNSFCRGGFISVNPIEKNDGSEVYFQLRGNIRKNAKGNVVWLLPYSGVARLWVYIDAQFAFAKQEIKKSEKKQRDELSRIVDKVSEHLRKMKSDIKELKREIRHLKDENDNQSTVSGRTTATNFSKLKIYKDEDE
uniref:Uncharacterized protein n=1 Tax=viral metagenome TaxID=1070528 RepID=A0A6C0LM76_9ZZZZ